jgi:hypothetical protein
VAAEEVATTTMETIMVVAVEVAEVEATSNTRRITT